MSNKDLTGEMETFGAEFLRLVGQFTDLLPGLASDPSDQIRVFVIGRRLNRLITLIVEAPTRNAALIESSLPSMTVGLTALKRQVVSLEASLLAELAGSEPFDEEEFGKKIHSMSDEDLKKELERLVADDCDDDELKQIEGVLEGLAGLKPISRLARIKALILVIIELIIRIKLPAADSIVKALRKAAKLIDDLIKGKPAGAGTGDGAGDNGGSGLTPKANDKAVCLVEVWLRSITAQDIDRVGRKSWGFDFQVGGRVLDHLAGTFDTSTPAKFPIRDKHRLSLFTDEGCGDHTLKLEVKIVCDDQPGGMGEHIENIEYKCDRVKRPHQIEVRVHPGGNITKPASLVTITLEIFGVCTELPKHEEQE